MAPGHGLFRIVIDYRLSKAERGLIEGETQTFSLRKPLEGLFTYGKVGPNWNVPSQVLATPAKAGNALKFARKFKRIKGLWKIASICVVCLGLAEKTARGQLQTNKQIFSTHTSLFCDQLLAVCGGAGGFLCKYYVR